jgi:hypothetical protein
MQESTEPAKLTEVSPGPSDQRVGQPSAAVAFATAGVEAIHAYFMLKGEGSPPDIKLTQPTIQVITGKVLFRGNGLVGRGGPFGSNNVYDVDVAIPHGLYGRSPDAAEISFALSDIRNGGRATDQWYDVERRGLRWDNSHLHCGLRLVVGDEDGYLKAISFHATAVLYDPTATTQLRA